MITDEEIRLVKRVLARALDNGADKARATLNKSSENLVATLDGEIDKVTRCEDRSLSLALFAKGRYGSFSTNRLDEDALEEFIAKSVSITESLSEDLCRDLPDPDRCCNTAKDGKECGTYDPEVLEVTPEFRCRTALEAAVYGSDERIISEEGEFSDGEYDCYVADTQGLECRQTETSFDYGVEVTIESGSGEKYSGYGWHSSPFLKSLEWKDCGKRALDKAIAQTGAAPIESGKYNMVVDSDVASKMVSPLLNAINGFSILQKNSFLMDSLGKQLFPEGLTIMDSPFIQGESGSRLFDSEGVKAIDGPIIEKGVVRRYFINTYLSNKLKMPATIGNASRPEVLGWPRKGLTRKDIMQQCGSGILVTDFNGGNCNSATGDFSYGIEGFYFKDGSIVKPVNGMLVTGNFLKLWQGLIAAGSDARRCMLKLIPTLAFSNVDFNG